MQLWSSPSTMARCSVWSVRDAAFSYQTWRTYVPAGTFPIKMWPVLSDTPKRETQRLGPPLPFAGECCKTRMPRRNGRISPFFARRSGAAENRIAYCRILRRHRETRDRDSEIRRYFPPGPPANEAQTFVVLHYAVVRPIRVQACRLEGAHRHEPRYNFAIVLQGLARLRLIQPHPDCDLECRVSHRISQIELAIFIRSRHEDQHHGRRPNRWYPHPSLR